MMVGNVRNIIKEELLIEHFSCGMMKHGKHVSSKSTPHQKCRNCVEVDNVEIDEEDGSNSYRPLPGQRTTDKCGIKEFSDPQEQKCVLQAAGIFSHLFEVIFQMTVNVHTLNFALLLGDTALNCLRVPWYRISYFILWTSAFVIFQWVLHACFSVWWPYPFLDLSSPYSPLWYGLSCGTKGLLGISVSSRIIEGNLAS
ncbi:hypothetical protein CDL15_Pgr005711 [Punica granatum]|uniref:Uncharacterized protein n=1 Tax=Punica granatum TaxID=22663 RepID=A0A218WFA4_PUNGR|nr:hypothetical protein CDL15_Pgr005711 [Punica granatum]